MCVCVCVCVCMHIMNKEINAHTGQKKKKIHCHTMYITQQ